MEVSVNISRGCDRTPSEHLLCSVYTLNQLTNPFVIICSYSFIQLFVLSLFVLSISSTNKFPILEAKAG